MYSFLPTDQMDVVHPLSVSPSHESDEGTLLLELYVRSKPIDVFADLCQSRRTKSCLAHLIGRHLVQLH